MLNIKPLYQVLTTAFLTLITLSANGQQRTCQELSACIQQSGCENPAMFGNTEERRTACIKRCAQTVDECQAKQRADSLQEEKMKAAGGKPAPVCPRNYIFTGHPRDQDRFGNYKCFGAESDPVPARFQCPTGMELHIPPGSKGMIICRWKITN